MPDLAKHCFLDARGRTWRLELNYGQAVAIERSLGVDLANAHNGRAFQQLAADDGLLVATLFAIVEDQAAAQDVSPEEFARGFNGSVFEAATDAVGEMILNFSRPGVRPIIAAMLAKGAEGRAGAIRLATSKLSGPAATALIARQLASLDQQLEAALNPPTPTNSPMNGPASPASIPAASASANSIGSPAAATSNSGTIPAA